MNVFRLAVFGAAVLLSGAALAAPSLTPAQKTVVCGKRATCRVTAIHNAGKDGHGAPIAVAEVLFGIKDKPDDAPDNGCDAGNNDGKGNGGTEYWLLSGPKPVNVLALCNDGYGASDVGEDTVKITNNRLSHDQYGGSAWRWENTDLYSLSPFQLLSQTSCSYFNLNPANGNTTYVDFAKFRAVEIAKNPGAKWADDDSSIGCPDTTPSMFAAPKPIPGDKLVAAFPVMQPQNNTDAALTNIPSGITVGDCAMALSTDGRGGFLSFGQPASTNVAEMRVIAPNSKTLLLQIYDPVAAPAPSGRSWISSSHAEVWTAGDYDADTQGAPTRAELGQIAVGLDGALQVLGKAKVPKVSRWTAKDEKGRSVTVLKLQWQDDLSPIVVSYSQAENGRQARLVTTVAMARGVPMFMPGTVTMQNKCAIRSGRLERAGLAAPTPQ